MGKFIIGPHMRPQQWVAVAAVCDRRTALTERRYS
jgi:hypothetical protein